MTENEKIAEYDNTSFNIKPPSRGFIGRRLNNPTERLII